MQPRQLDAKGDQINGQKDAKSTPREDLRRHLKTQRVLLDYTAADRANHTYAIIGQVRRHMSGQDIT